MIADLHLHTIASDGTYTPAEMVKQAEDNGYTAIAITDHDTTDGLTEALASGKKLGVEVIPGIELSTLDNDREIHILGYYPDPENAQLIDMLSQMIEARKNRAAKMVEKLNHHGIDISLTRVKEIAGGQFVGRPHIAQALLEKGYITEMAEAFSEDFIGRGGLGYVERFKITPAEGIKALKQAGAIPVLAHPGFLSKGEPVSEEEIKSLIKAGLRGIEVFYSKHTPDQTELYKSLATKHGLLITGGSDCHGQPNVPNSLGSIQLPYQYIRALKEENDSNKRLHNKQKVTHS